MHYQRPADDRPVRQPCGAFRQQHPLRSRRSTGRSRQRGSAVLADTAPIVSQISQIVAANQTLQREHQELQAENDQLKAQLHEIGDALNVLIGRP